MSRFTETMFGNAVSSRNGMTTGEPYAPVRHSSAQVHERARRVAGGLAAVGVGHGDAVAVLAGAHQTRCAAWTVLQLRCSPH